MDPQNGVKKVGTIEIDNTQFYIFLLNTKEIQGEALDKLAEVIYRRNVFMEEPIDPFNVDYIKIDIKNRSDVDIDSRYFILELKNKEIGYLRLYWETRVNTQFTWYTLYIDPEFRDLNLEKLFVKSTINELADATNIITYSKRKGYPSNSLFEDLEGARLVLNDRISGSNIQLFDLKEVKAKTHDLLIESDEKGFYFVKVMNGQFDSNQKIKYSEFLKMVEALWNDMPREESTREDEVLSEKLHRSFYQHLELKKQTSVSFIAIEKATGELAGYTETWLCDYRPTVAMQDDTGVLKKFRGNQLGLALKYQMVLHMLEDPKFKNVNYWVTGNADSNAPMLHINEKLGYKQMYVSNDYEISLENFKKLLI